MEPYFYVVKKTDPKLENVNVGDQIVRVQEKDYGARFKSVKEAPSAEKFENILSGTTIKYRDESKGVARLPPQVGEMIIYLKKMKSEDDFFDMWNFLMKKSRSRCKR